MRANRPASTVPADRKETDDPVPERAPRTRVRVPMIGPPTAEGRSRAYAPAALLEAEK